MLSSWCLAFVIGPFRLIDVKIAPPFLNIQGETREAVCPFVYTREVWIDDF